MALCKAILSYALRIFWAQLGKGELGVVVWSIYPIFHSSWFVSLKNGPICIYVSLGWELKRGLVGDSKC